jgi:hypothetical protein
VYRLEAYVNVRGVLILLSATDWYMCRSLPYKRKAANLALNRAEIKALLRGYMIEKNTMPPKPDRMILEKVRCIKVVHQTISCAVAI